MEDGPEVGYCPKDAEYLVITEKGNFVICYFHYEIFNLSQIIATNPPGKKIMKEKSDH